MERLIPACQMYDFRKYLESATLKGDILILDEKCTPPLDHALKHHQNVVLVRPQLWHFLCIFEHLYVNKTDRFPSLLISGPPGCGKVSFEPTNLLPICGTM